MAADWPALQAGMLGVPHWVSSSLADKQTAGCFGAGLYWPIGIKIAPWHAVSTASALCARDCELRDCHGGQTWRVQTHPGLRSGCCRCDRSAKAVLGQGFNGLAHRLPAAVFTEDTISSVAHHSNRPAPFILRSSWSWMPPRLNYIQTALCVWKELQ